MNSTTNNENAGNARIAEAYNSAGEVVGFVEECNRELASGFGFTRSHRVFVSNQNLTDPDVCRNIHTMEDRFKDAMSYFYRFAREHPQFHTMNVSQGARQEMRENDYPFALDAYVPGLEYAPDIYEICEALELEVA